MSCPDLSLCIHAPVNLGDIGSLLGVKFSQGKPGRLMGSYEYEERLGGIAFSEITNVPHFYGEYGQDWKIVLNLSCGRLWADIRIVAVVHLCDWLLEDFNGKYLAFDSTHGTIFFATDKKFIFNSKYKNKLTACAFPQASYAFKELTSF